MLRKIAKHTIPASYILSAVALIAAAGFSAAVYLSSNHDFVADAAGSGKELNGNEFQAGSVLEPLVLSEEDEIQYGSWPALANADFFEQVKEGFLEEKQSFIETDLTAMKIRVYKAGEVVLEVPILTKGRPGSWWETPAGLYEVQSKQENHFSSFGHVYQPWSMAFQGNFFIHGWPYYPDGSPVASTYSGGCVRLSSEDAQAVYELAEVGMPILVYAAEFLGDDFRYPAPAGGGASTLRGLSAKEYLAADLKNNYVFLAQGSTAEVPIASITKLMTALIAAEYINLDSEMTVSREALIETARPRLRVGERITAYQLLYPLLTESSNEAAYVLAEHLGHKRFIDLMNRKAAALGMKNTRFTDSSGLDDGNTSNAEDLFALAKYLVNNRSFILKITADTVGYNAYGESQFQDLRNYNIFIGEDDFVGGKIGSTPGAGKTIVSIFDLGLGQEDRPVVIVALGSTDIAGDTRKIRQYILTNY